MKITELRKLAIKREKARQAFNKYDEKLSKNCHHPKSALIHGSYYSRDTLGNLGEDVETTECNICGAFL